MRRLNKLYCTLNKVNFSLIGLTIFFITFGRHIIVAGKTEVFEAWQIDWMCRFEELTGEPTTEGERLVLKVPVRF